jgi:hypothetical protein
MARKPLMHSYIYFETLEVGSDCVVPTGLRWDDSVVGAYSLSSGREGKPEESAPGRVSDFDHSRLAFF